jgi:RimJ/RimL family protein N-acetyltransferase
MCSEINLSPLKFEDLRFFYALRNRYRHLLHDDRLFELKDVEKWFIEQSPAYLLITLSDADNTRAGYVRQTKISKTSLMIGCDVHPTFIRQGIATEVYDILVDLLLRRGPIKEFVCYILSHNIVSLSFALHYGFHVEPTKSGTRNYTRNNKQIDNICLSLRETDL